MAPVTLPPSFYNSFWSADYRTGLEILFKELDKGCTEAQDVADFIESQAKGHHALSQTLLLPPSSTPPSTSSLQHTLLALKGASSARGEAHRALAVELENRILVGFQQWAERHHDRVIEGRKEVLGKNGVVGVWEKEVGKLNTLKAAYASKTRLADDGEDDARFAPSTASIKSPSTTSTDGNITSPSPKTAALKRSGTVADRITEKLRAASITSSNGITGSSPLNGSTSSSSRLHKQVLSIDGKMLPPPPTPSGDGSRSPFNPTSPKEEAFIPPTDPDGRPTMGPSVPEKEKSDKAVLEVSPPPILLSGLSLSAKGLKDILARFDAYLLTNPAPNADTSTTSTKSNPALASRQRTSMLGTYDKTFSGEEVIEWLRDNVEGFGGDWDRCIDAAKELTSMGHFSRIGVSVQRGFEGGSDTYYILRTNPLTDPSPVSALSAAAMDKIHLASIGSPLSPATSANIQSMLKSYVPARFAASDEPTHVRLRREAGKADEAYKEGVRVVEMKRLEMEEAVERGLRVWERWERERLGVIQQVLKQYEAALARLPARLAALQESTNLSVEAYNPDADLKALIEGNRTGPFRPQPHIYESLEIDQPDINFGLDLRRWAGDAGWRSAAMAPKREKGAVPEVLEAMLGAIEKMGEGMKDDVPLSETHALRNSLNNPEMSIPDLQAIIQKFNLPIAAGVVKLWLLELYPPVMGWEGWEDAKAIYPTVGADQERDMTSAVISVLGRLGGVQIFVLDALVGYLRRMIDQTKTEEDNQIYITKLALSLGRCILRPQSESDLTIGDRTPSLFFADLLELYSAVLPPLVEKKKKEADRIMPVRKRTVLVDQRISRRNISEDDNTKELLERQMAMQHPSPTPPRSQFREEKNGNTETPSKGNENLGRQSLQGQTSSTTIFESNILPTTSQSSLPAISGLGLGLGFDGPPKMKEPHDSDDESEPPFQPPTLSSVTVIPPTPAQTASASVPDQQQQEEGDTSATADILDGLIDGEEDIPISGAGTGGVGLKRAGSSDVSGSTAGGGSAASRLRGPRGARGPRPAGGRMLSMGGTEIAAATAAAGITTGTGDEGAMNSPTGSATSARMATGGLHRSKGSVSAMAARFEKS